MMNHTSPRMPTSRKGMTYMPGFEALVQSMRGIFERQYYTEHGPLVRQLEQELIASTGAAHAVCVTNEFVALLMLLNTLPDRAEIIVPALAPAWIHKALSDWFPSLSISAYDLDPLTLQLDLQSLLDAVRPNTRAVLVVNNWAGAAPMVALRRELEPRGVQVFAESTSSFGQTSSGQGIGSLGTAELFSLHHSNVFSAIEGAFISTNDADLADALRTMRSSSGVVRTMPVKKTVNGRMSEAHAAFAHLSLQQQPCLRELLLKQRKVYVESLNGISGLSLLMPWGVDAPAPSGDIVCRISESEFGCTGQELTRRLATAGYDARHNMALSPRATSGDWPGAHSILRDTVLLPMGARYSDQEINAAACAVRAVSLSR